MIKRITLIGVFVLAVLGHGAAAEPLCVAKMNGATVERVEVVNADALPQKTEAALIKFMQSLYGASTVWVPCSFDGKSRKQFPGIGYTRDAGADVFVAPKPYPSWSLDGSKDWQPPVAAPRDGQVWRWDERDQKWVTK